MHNLTTTQLIAVVCLFLVVIVVGLLWIRTLYLTLKKCAPASRTMRPGMVWLLLVPFFNWIWNFFVIAAMAKTLAAEFKLRNIRTTEKRPGFSLGLAMAIAQACSAIPYIKYLSWIPTVILWTMYWSKIMKFSRLLDKTAPVAETMETPQAI